MQGQEGAFRSPWPVVGIALLIAGLGGVSCLAQAAAGSTALPPSASPTITPAPTLTPSPTPSPLFSGEEAMQHVRAQMAFGPRPTGSEASRRTAEYIQTRLRAAGWEAEEQTFTYRGVPVRNLIGRAGQRGGPVFLLGAHYDTRLRADRDPEASAQPVPGANDGASGVAVLLELARVLDLSTVQGEVWLVFFDAEDNGRLDGWDWVIGSRYFATNMAVTPEYVIVVDMIGDAEQDIYYEGNSDPLLREHLWTLAAELGYSAYFIPEVQHTLLDDHVPFLERGIPAIDVIDFDYPYWHTVEDTVDKVSPESLERVGRVLETFLESGGRYPVSGEGAAERGGN